MPRQLDRGSNLVRAKRCHFSCREREDRHVHSVTVNVSPLAKTVILPFCDTFTKGLVKTVGLPVYGISRLYETELCKPSQTMRTVRTV